MGPYRYLPDRANLADRVSEDAESHKAAPGQPLREIPDGMLGIYSVRILRTTNPPGSSAACRASGLEAGIRMSPSHARIPQVSERIETGGGKERGLETMLPERAERLRARPKSLRECFLHAKGAMLPAEDRRLMQLRDLCLCSRPVADSEHCRHL